MRRHKAVTVIEIIVVISIVGVMIALLIPAMQAARDAAKRAAKLQEAEQRQRVIAGPPVFTPPQHRDHAPVLDTAFEDGTTIYQMQERIIQLETKIRELEQRVRDHHGERLR